MSTKYSTFTQLFADIGAFKTFKEVPDGVAPISRIDFDARSLFNKMKEIDPAKLTKQEFDVGIKAALPNAVLDKQEYADAYYNGLGKWLYDQDPNLKANLLTANPKMSDLFPNSFSGIPTTPVSPPRGGAPAPARTPAGVVERNLTPAGAKELQSKIPDALADNNIESKFAKTQDFMVEIAKRDPALFRKFYSSKRDEVEALMDGLTGSDLDAVIKADTGGMLGKALGVDSWCFNNVKKCAFATVTVAGGVGFAAYLTKDHLDSNANERKCKKDCKPENWTEYLVTGMDKSLLQYQEWGDSAKPVCTADMVDRDADVCEAYCKTECEDDSIIESAVQGAVDLGLDALDGILDEMARLLAEVASSAGDVAGNFLEELFGEYWWAWLIGIFVVLILGGVAIKRFMG